MSTEHQDCILEVAGSNPRSQHQLVLAGHQPVYLPGIATMAKMAIVDAWMWVGHCDYQDRSWQSRNYIRGYHHSRGKPLPLMLSVPLIHKSGPSINEKLIDGHRWVGHQLKTIEYSYAKRPYFNQYFPALRRTMEGKHATLGELNIGLASLLAEWLEIKTPVYDSRDFGIGLYPGNATLMLHEMCEKLEVSEYLSSEGERAYVKPHLMNSFAHRFIKFEHPIYDQGCKNFMPNLSVIDLVFNCGPSSGDIVRGCAK